jgi:plasmid stabilization system protein ParE
MYSVYINEIAENDILTTVQYISNVLKVPMAANKLLDEIEEKEKFLGDNPYIYPIVPDEILAKREIRFINIKNYMMFYIVNDNEQRVYVIRFLYGHRDWKNILEKDIEK